MLNEEIKDFIRQEIAFQLQGIIKKGERVPFTKDKPDVLTISQVLQAVSTSLEISIVDLKSKSRERDIVDARHVYTFLTEEFCPQASLYSVGRPVQKDHATVLHSRRKAKELIETDRSFKSKYDMVHILVKEMKEDIEFSYLNNHPQL